MHRIVWTRQAIADLDRLEAFLWHKSPDAARRQHIMNATQQLQYFPQAGRAAPDLDPEHRELPVTFGVSGYMVRYGVYATQVEILAIRHMREAGY